MFQMPIAQELIKCTQFYCDVLRLRACENECSRTGQFSGTDCRKRSKLKTEKQEEAVKRIRRLKMEHLFKQSGDNKNNYACDNDNAHDNDVSSNSKIARAEHTPIQTAGDDNSSADVCGLTAARQ
jgi:hypothetical protein